MGAGNPDIRKSVEVARANYEKGLAVQADAKDRRGRVRTHKDIYSPTDVPRYEACAGFPPARE